MRSISICYILTYRRDCDAVTAAVATEGGLQVKHIISSLFAQGQRVQVFALFAIYAE